jgi:hypothetical protein
MKRAEWHVLRTWTTPDPFAPACGCEVAACGFVAPTETCEQHALTSGKTMRGVHEAGGQLCRALSGERATAESAPIGPETSPQGSA